MTASTAGEMQYRQALADLSSSEDRVRFVFVLEIAEDCCIAATSVDTQCPWSFRFYVFSVEFAFVLHAPTPPACARACHGTGLHDRHSGQSAE